ncbi:MAG: hypothetical protein GEEBNDBF_00253 [bacterium]|nr:hypothetical protein [bacterium]
MHRLWNRRRVSRGIAMLEYALILMFTSVMMIVITYTVMRLLPGYYRVLLGTMISGTV